MGSAPDTVNSSGDVLTDDMRKQLEKLSPDLKEGPGGAKFGPYSAAAKEVLSNWMFGIRPTPIDPGKAFSDASTLSGVYGRASAGMGIGGLFGFGSSVGSTLPTLPSLDMGPMSKGVPYSVPPLPTMPKLPKFPGGGG